MKKKLNWKFTRSKIDGFFFKFALIFSGMWINTPLIDWRDLFNKDSNEILSKEKNNVEVFINIFRLRFKWTLMADVIKKIVWSISLTILWAYFHQWLFKNRFNRYVLIWFDLFGLFLQKIRLCHQSLMNNRLISDSHDSNRDREEFLALVMGY